MSALEIEQLSYTYHSDFLRREIPALSNVSLCVSEGECFGYLGPNGAGKTTTIKCILGLIKPRAGFVKIFGLSSLTTHSRAAVGYLPEQPYFYDYLTVAETMEMYGSLAGLRGRTLRKEVSAALERLNMLSRAGDRMRSLSKGLTQRVAMAQAIVCSPKLLILDEPFSGLDPLGRQEFKDLLFQLRRDGVTIFTSSHILSDVEHLCSRVSIAQKGRLLRIIDLDKREEFMSGHCELVVRRGHSRIEELIARASDHREQGQSILLEFEQRSAGEEALNFALQEKIQVDRWEYCHRSLEETFMDIVKA